MPKGMKKTSTDSKNFKKSSVCSGANSVRNHMFFTEMQKGIIRAGKNSYLCTTKITAIWTPTHRKWKC